MLSLVNPTATKPGSSEAQIPIFSSRQEVRSWIMSNDPYMLLDVCHRSERMMTEHAQAAIYSRYTRPPHPPPTPHDVTAPVGGPPMPVPLGFGQLSWFGV